MQTASPEGSVLFTYVQTDEFCERYETSKAVTTSSWESSNHLTKKLIKDPRNRQKAIEAASVLLANSDQGFKQMLGGQPLRQQQLGCIQTILPSSDALDYIACIQLYFITMLQTQTVSSIIRLQQLLRTINLCCMQMLNFHAMFIMADLGNEHTVAGSSEKVLCVIRTHQDGSFDMTPGFNSGGHKCRFEDDFGGYLVTEQAETPSSQPICMSLLNDVVA